MTVADFFATRNAELEAGTLRLLAQDGAQTATCLRTRLKAGMRELDRVLQRLRVDGRIQTKRRLWSLVP